MFIVDRSYSMSGERMETSKTALKLFLRSLPVGSKFAIISFGSSYSFMTINGQQIIDYNNNTSEQAIQLIDRFGADCGGTEILGPLKAAQQKEIQGYQDYNKFVSKSLLNHYSGYGEKIAMIPPKDIVNKRIFLLTDGQVGNS